VSPRRSVVFVDSSFWLAVASASDGRHREADAALRDAVRRRASLFTTNLVLGEVHRIVLRRVGVRAAATVLDRIDASPAVAVTFPALADHRAARRWLARLADQRISYVDAVSFAVMAAARCELALTFARGFRLAGFDVAPGP
jgi:predicted nucleic acid-binding protein